MSGTIIAGVDGSAPGRNAAEFAAGMAERRGFSLELLHAFTWPLIYPPLVPDPTATAPLPRVRAEQILTTTATEVGGLHPDLSIETRIVDGHAAGVLIEASRRASLLVVGHRGLGGFTEMLVGSVGVYTSTHAACPVVIVRGQLSSTDAPVIVGADGSPGSRAAVRLAFEEARLRAADLVVVLGWPPARTWPEALSAAGMPADAAAVDPLAVSLAGIAEEFPEVKVHTEVRHTVAPPELLMALAMEIGASLIVVGSRGVGGFRGLLMGSTCRALVDHAPCPVVVVPKGAHVT